MKDTGLHPERVGALIDGRLAPEDRASALVRLAASEDDRAVFAGTAEVLQALEEEAAAPAPPERAARRPWRRLPPWARGLLAAGIVLVVGLPLALRPRGFPPPEQSLAALSSPGQGVPAGWPSAAASRGGTAPLDPGALASAAGVAHLHILLAARAGNEAAKAAAVADAVARLRAAEGLLAASYAELAAASTTEQRIVQTGREAERTLDAARFRLGAWAEAARLAAAREDAAFFRTGATAAALRRASAPSSLPESASTALEELRGLVSAPGSPNWERIEATAAQLTLSITA